MGLVPATTSALPFRHMRLSREITVCLLHPVSSASARVISGMVHVPPCQSSSMIFHSLSVTVFLSSTAKSPFS